MRNLFIDAETFYDSKNGYGLKDLCITEYIRDNRFKVHGFAYAWDEGEVHWVSGDHVISAWVASVKWEDVTVISHNTKFDGSILAWRYGVKPYAWFDTMALAKAVLGEKVSGYSLASLAEYLGLKSKGTLKWDGVLDLTTEQEAEMSEYCKNDVELCKGIHDKLMGQFPRSQLSAIDWTIRAFIEPKLVLDQKVLQEGVEKEKARREEVIKAGGVEKSVLASNKQFAELLVHRGFTVPTKLSSRTGKPIPAFAKTDNGLAELAVESPELYAARIASKANLLETRGEALLAVAKTGNFPFDVGFSGAVQTHRYSGASGAGGNPQNFTRKSFLRRAVTAPPTYSLVVGDFAAVELRILAWLAREPKLIGKLIADEDVYADFASSFYGRPVPPKEPTPERFFGKCAILGLGYGMGGEKFQRTVKAQLKQDITEGAAYAAVKFYRSTYFNVPKLWDVCSSLISLIATGQIGCLYFAPFIRVRKGALVLPSGLEIRYPNLRQQDGEWVYDVYRKKYQAETTKLYGGKLVENICQGLAGEICKEAIDRAEIAGLSCVGAVHDEIIAVTQYPEMGVKVLTKAMEQSPSWWPLIRLKSEVHYGKNWAECK